MLFRKKRTYLDWASAAPVSKAAQRAFSSALANFGNPSSPHTEGVQAKRILEDARTTIARLAEAKASGVIFTSGATEANNLGLTGVAMHYKAKGEQVHILYLPSSHSSVIETLKSLTPWGVETEPLVVTNGKVDLEKLKTQLRPETRLVSIDAVCGETGTMWDTRGVRNTLNAYKEGILLHVDASQAPLGIPWSLTRFTADTISLDAQKVGGIRGVGALCMRSRVKLASLMHGGGQEGGLRPGTEPVALAAAFAAALTECEKNREEFRSRSTNMRHQLIDTLIQAIPDILINEGKEGVPHILNISLPDRDTDYTVMLLDKEGFAVSTKSACESDSEEGSRAVLCITKDAARARSTLRISWGPATTSRDLRRFAAALISTVRFQSASSV